MFTQPGVSRTLQGSNTNIVGILFLYQTFLENILGKTRWTASLHNQVYQEVYKDPIEIFVLDFLEKILGKTRWTASLHNQAFQEFLRKISYKHWLYKTGERSEHSAFLVQLSWKRFLGK